MTVFPLLMLGFTMLTTFLYQFDLPLLVKLNEFITGRITMQSYAFKIVGFPIFGLTGNGWVTPYFIDNAYYSMMLRFGLLYECVYLGLYTRIYRVVKPRSRFIVGGIIMIMAVFGLLQAKYMEIFVNPFLLLMFIPEESHDLIS